MVKARSIKDYSDDDLVRMARTDPNKPGDPQANQAASELLGRYQGRVYTWCRRYVRDHESALDLAQEVLVNAYRNLDTFAGSSQFSTWLFAIARNRCLSEVRRPRLLTSDDMDLDRLPHGQANPEQALEERLDEEAILTIIRENLEPREQDALWMRCFERIPVDTITELLNITEASGARAVLQQARRKLRAALQDRPSAAEGGTS